MVNKLWYQEYPEETKWPREYLQKYINFYCSDSKLFKVPEDITLDNLKEFLEIILRQYQYYNISNARLLDLGDAFDKYLGIAFRDEFPDDYPNYSNEDRRQLALDVCDNCLQHSTWPIFPEDVPFVIECLNAPEAEIVNMYDRLDKYFDQFDRIKRNNEEWPNRWLVITKERIQALQNNDPLPIKPMSMKIDSCYEDKNRLPNYHKWFREALMRPQGINKQNIKWSRKNPGLKEENVALLENISFIIPRSYIELMKISDGGSFENNEFEYHDVHFEEKLRGSIKIIYSITTDSTRNLNHFYDTFGCIINNYYNTPESFPRNPRTLVPFGNDGEGNLICFDYRADPKNDDPSIVFWRFSVLEERSISFVAKNFEEFLTMLKKPNDEDLYN